MAQKGPAGEDIHGGRTVVVGVKLDSYSNELLTWALAKVAEPGDTVVALHVLVNNETVNLDGKLSLLSLVKAFDPVLAVYDGLCNLKQVDLKLKIRKGSSVKKVLVQEVNAYAASNVIVGTSQRRHKIRSSKSVAKYCARKLSKDCCILAVNNGKVLFNHCRDASPLNAVVADLQGIDCHCRNGLSGSNHWTLNKSSKVLSDDTKSMDVDKGAGRISDNSLAKLFLDSTETVRRESCSICGPTLALPDISCHQSEEGSSGEDGNENSLAILPVKTIGPSQLEFKPGWPLLRQKSLSARQHFGRSSLRHISVVQWAMRLPCRHLPYAADHDHRPDNFDRGQDQYAALDSETGALVAVGAASATAHSHEYNSVSIPRELEGLHDKYSATCRLFQYKELVSATSNFLPENLIGKGGSSRVYKGCLRDGKELAVKILKPSDNVLNEFLLEIEIITTLHHKNIISLFGFCFENDNLILVYDFLSRGSLEENLHGNKKNPIVFGWTERYKVAMGVAEALDYLHCKDDQPVIHRDVKSSNVLLSEDFEPQLCDFGLATWASASSSHITCTDVAGTFGYLAPEYFMYGKVTDKIDVYAFGVVLLELLSGRKPISNDYPKGQESLVMWASPILDSGKTLQLLDPSFGDNYDHEEMERMVLAATLCIRRDPKARPQMSLISKILQGDTDVIKWARLEVNASEAPEMLDDEACAPSNLQSHLNLALLDVEDDSLSMCSVEQNVWLEDYLRGRWSCRSSFTEHTTANC
ncbi:hypothetical protein TanjilG_09663 [Lupinus angustifolius]|uniref:Protein kinase domain-containing protein n=1 Tax=Lupinus angustifolius TaxID=3871 RepID=A0A4P1R4F4_LUPAN|nr:PREDICTED: probable receptor-like serine/threonine-protein kinase At5g57670 isoform X2 [Lupinus angustifolius]OIW00694.1 hypothetical protein TanjilG_09663 [Lupinus angustifolius]